MSLQTMSDNIEMTETSDAREVKSTGERSIKALKILQVVFIVVTTLIVFSLMGAAGDNYSSASDAIYWAMGLTALTFGALWVAFMEWLKMVAHYVTGRTRGTIA